ncbi:MAG: hypothetical protein WC547_10330 [Candidatus Omnitrophota bacterium]
MRKKLINALCFAVLAGFVSTLYAQPVKQFYNLTSGGEECIDEWGLKKKVKNNCSLNVFIPTNTSQQWNAFVNNAPTNTGCVQIGECMTCEDYGAVTDVRSGVTYCVWYPNLYWCGGGCPGSASGIATLNLPSTFSNAKFTLASFDDSGWVSINGVNIYFKPPCSSSVAPNIDVTSRLHAGANAIGWTVGNDCGGGMVATIAIEYRLE